MQRTETLQRTRPIHVYIRIHMRYRYLQTDARLQTHRPCACIICMNEENRRPADGQAAYAESDHGHVAGTSRRNALQHAQWLMPTHGPLSVYSRGHGIEKSAVGPGTAVYL